MRIPLMLILAMAALSWSADSLFIAILDFEVKGIAGGDGSIFADKLRTELSKQPGVTIVARDQMGEILAEQAFQQTGCTSAKCAVQVGQLLGVNFMVTGTVSKMDSTYFTSLRLVNVESGKMERNAEHVFTGTLSDVLLVSIPKVAKEIVGKGDDSQSRQIAETFGALKINVWPDSASVTIGNVSYGKGDIVIPKLPSGSHTVMIQTRNSPKDLAPFPVAIRANDTTTLDATVERTTEFLIGVGGGIMPVSSAKGQLNFMTLQSYVGLKWKNLIQVGVSALMSQQSGVPATRRIGDNGNKTLFIDPNGLADITMTQFRLNLLQSVFLSRHFEAQVGLSFGAVGNLKLEEHSQGRWTSDLKFNTAGFPLRMQAGLDPVFVYVQYEPQFGVGGGAVSGPLHPITGGLLFEF